MIVNRSIDRDYIKFVARFVDTVCRGGVGTWVSVSLEVDRNVPHREQ